MDVHIGCVKRKQTLLSQLQLIFAYHNTLEVFHDEKEFKILWEHSFIFLIL